LALTVVDDRIVFEPMVEVPRYEAFFWKVARQEEEEKTVDVDEMIALMENWTAEEDNGNR